MKIAFPTDEHVPFQDERAVELARRLVADFAPEIVIRGSDGIDFYAISTFDKNPERFKVSLQDEIDKWKAGERAWRDAAGTARRLYLPGNHEDRLRRYLWRHPEIASLRALSLRSVLGLDELGIEYALSETDVNQEYVFGGPGEPLKISHGRFVRRVAGQSAYAELVNEHFSISTVTGHSHRGGSVYARTRAGMVQAHEGFCLCQLDPEYIPRPNWQQGLLLITLDSDSLQVEAVPFETYGTHRRALWRGREYQT